MATPTDVILQGVGTKFPKWATEKTLDEMNTNVKALAANFLKKKDLLNLSTKKSQKSMSDFDTVMGGLTEDSKKNQAGLKDFRKGIKDTHATSTASFKNIAQTAKHSSLSMSVVSDVGSELGNVLKGLATPVGLLGTLFAGIVVGGGLFLEYLKNTAEMSKNLYDTGLTFQNGLSDLRYAAADAAMPLNSFGKLMIKNSALIKAFGADGAKGFGNVLKQTQGLVQAQGGYGLTLTEINDYSTDYMETLRKQGVFSKMTDRDRSAANADYIKNLTAFSQIMGKSREQIAKETNAIMDSSLVTAGLAALTPEQHAIFQNTVASLSGALGDLSGVFTDQLTKSAFLWDGSVNDMSQSMMLAGGDVNRSFQSLAKGVASGTMTEEQSVAARKHWLESIRDMSAGQVKNLQGIAKAGVHTAEINDILSAHQKLQGADLDKLATASAKGPDTITKAYVDLQNTWTGIQANFQEVFANFLDTNQATIQSISVNIADFAKYLATQLKSVLEWVSKFIDPRTRDEAIADLKAGITSLFDKMIDYVGKAMIDGIKGMGTTIMSSITDTIGSGNFADSFKTIGIVSAGLAAGFVLMGPAISALIPILAAAAATAAIAEGAHAVGRSVVEAATGVDLSSSDTTEVENGAVVGSKVWRENQIIQHNVRDLAGQKGGTDILMSPATRSNNDALEMLRINADREAVANPEIVDYVKRLDVLIKLQEDANDLAKQHIELSEDQKKALETANNNAKWPSGTIR